MLCRIAGAGFSSDPERFPAEPKNPSPARTTPVLQIDIAEKRFPARGAQPDRAAPGAAAGLTALADFRLTVADGEFVCLVGPSGCGKSTLLDIVNGLDRDYRGRVTLTDGGKAAAVATMFQNPRLMPWLSVLDNVLLVLEDSPASRDLACELLVEMGLGDALDAYPSRLSGGMQRRVALARAFAIQPQLLLMDEPFVSLDAPTADRLRSMLAEVWRRHRASVLFVTHDLAEALTLADRVAFLSASPGRVVLEMPIALSRPRQPAAISELQTKLLYAQPDLLAGFAGSNNGAGG